MPINTRDVRTFKKETWRLMDDPFGVAKRMNEFLNTNIYSYEDISLILKSPFNTKEKMIKQAKDTKLELQKSSRGD